MRDLVDTTDKHSKVCDPAFCTFVFVPFPHSCRKIVQMRQLEQFKNLENQSLLSVKTQSQHAHCPQQRFALSLLSRCCRNFSSKACCPYRRRGRRFSLGPLGSSHWRPEQGRRPKRRF